jgi:hypothetical protein
MLNFATNILRRCRDWCIMLYLATMIAWRFRFGSNMFYMNQQLQIFCGAAAISATCYIWLQILSGSATIDTTRFSDNDDGVAMSLNLY